MTLQNKNNSNCIEEKAEKWDTLKLGRSDISQVIMGQSPPSATYNQDSKGLPFLQGKAEFGEMYPSPIVFCSQPIKVAEPNDILVSVRAPVGDVNIAPFKCCIGRGLASIRPNTQKLHNLYLYYFLRTRKQKFESLSSGSTFKAIKKEVIENFQISLPPLLEQKKIADILSTVDKALEKVDEAIEMTQRLKKGLMQELLTGRWNTVDGRHGKREFKQTEMGRIPKGWEVVDLGAITDINRGKFAHRPRNEPKFYGGNIPFIQTGDISEANGIIREYSQTLNEDGLSISKLFKKGTIVISIAGNIGDVGMLDFDACFPDSVVGIIAHIQKADQLFLMYLLQDFKYKLSSSAPRSTQKNINLEILHPLKLPLPPLPEQKKIAEILSTVDKRMELLKKKRESFGRVKKGLMNDLLSGRRRVTNLITKEET